MTKREMYTGSVSHSRSKTTKTVRDRERMLRYKALAVAFSYPDDALLDIFPGLSDELEKLSIEYDRLFRAKSIWLYGTEYTAKSEFQRANFLSDIVGFYKAFGVEAEKDRPDSLVNELEFMHFLIFKMLHALEDNIPNGKEKAAICLDAQKKFFDEHFYPAAKKIAEIIIREDDSNFYQERAKELLNFLKSERVIFGGK